MILRVNNQPRISWALAVVAAMVLVPAGYGTGMAWAVKKGARPFSGSPIERLMGGGRADSKASDKEVTQGSSKKRELEKAGEKIVAEPAHPSTKKKVEAKTKDKTSVEPKPAAENHGKGREKGKSKSAKAPPEEKKGPDAAQMLKQGRAAAEKGNHSVALEKYRLALKAAENRNDLKATAAAMSGTARMSHRLGRDREALNMLRGSIKIYRELKNARARSLDYLLSGRILMDQSRYQRAVKSFEESLKILPESEAAERPRLLEEMASCQLRLNRLSDALDTYGRLLAILGKDGKKKKESARIHVLTAELQLSRSDYRGAASNFKKAENIHRKLGLKKELGETLLRSAYGNRASGKLDAAGKAVKEGRSLLADQRDADIHALPLLVKGMNDHERGKIVRAIKRLTLALNRYRKIGDRLMAARARLALGKVEKDRARMKSALEHGGKALTEFRVLSDKRGEAGALRLISHVYFRQGFVQKALEYAQESLAIAKQINWNEGMIRARVILAEIHTRLGEVDFAWKLLKEALEGGGKDRRTRGRVRLAVARFRLKREASSKALKAGQAARKDFKETGDIRGMADCDNLMGRVHELQGDRKKALELFQEALKGHRTVWDRYGEGSDLTALGIHFKNLGDHDKSLSYFRKADDLRKRIGDRRGHAAALANIGNLLKHRSQIPEAQKSLEQALRIYRELSDKKGEADILTNLANVHAAGRSHSLAIEKLNKALELHREVYDIRGVATDLAGIGRLYLERGDLANAATHLEEAAKANKRINNPRGDVAILAELAMVEGAKRNTGRALSLLNRALKLARKTNDARAISSIYLKKATLLKDTGSFEKALSLLSETLEMMRRQGDRQGELWALGEKGIVQVKMENYESALEDLHRAVELRAELGLPPGRSRDLDFHLGEIYEGFKDFEQALEHYHKALAMAQITGTDTVLGRIYDRIGNIYYQIEEYGKAREFFQDALRVHTETDSVAMQKSELIRLGDIMSKLGDSEAALKYQIRALTLTRETEDGQTEGRILTRIGTLYQVLGRPRTAMDYYRQAMEKRTEIGDRRGVNENLLQIALVTSILGDFESAVSNLKRAFEISHRSEDRSMLWKAYFIMGRTLQGRRRLGEALESYRKAITILEAMEADIIEESDEDNFIFGGKTALFETTLRVLMKLARKDPEGAYDAQALRIVEKLKAAAFHNELARTNVAGFSDVPRELLVKEKSLKLSLRKLNARLAAELTKVSTDQGEVEKLIKERRAREGLFMKLKARLVREYPAYAALMYPRPVSVHQLQKQVVDPDEAILEFLVTRSRTYLFAVDKRRFYTYSIDYAHKDLQRDVHALLRPLYRSDTQASWDPSVAYRLYSRLIKPVEYFLAGKKAVMVIPHGPLASLPFEILVSSSAHSGKRFWSVTDRPTYLVEKYAFAYAPTASLLSYLRTRERQGKPGWNLVAFGDAVYPNGETKTELNRGAEKLLTAFTGASGGTKGPSLRPLPGTRKEISEIAKIMGGPVQAYFGAQATETLFKKADLSRYGYIHLATHGVLVGSAGKLRQQPAIVFSLHGDKENDGFLQLGEVFGLKFNCDLLVLSSCLSPGKNSPLNSDGLMGLSRAFLFAGADSVILSMWQVNEESTARLFIKMYDNLQKVSKAEALRRAKIALVKSRATSHPYYWGPFVLMGRWHVKYRPGFNKVDPKEMRFKGLSTWSKFLNM